MAEQPIGVTLMEIVKQIRDVNLNEKKDYPIPTSDSMYRKYMEPIVESEKELKDCLHLLVEAHYLFPLSIVESDDMLMISGIEGYVSADIPSLKVLKERAYSDLEAAYEQQMYRRKQADTIIREMLPQARNYNNTPMGRNLNVAVMLNQFEQVLISGFAEYTSTWRRRKLKELVPDLDVASLGSADDEAGDDGATEPDALAFEADPPPSDVGAPQAGSVLELEADLHEPPLEIAGSFDLESAEGSQMLSSVAEDVASRPARAIDSVELTRIQEMDRSGRWGQAVDRYGAQFLLRIHFRKYEFDKVRWLLRTGKIAREEDLRFVRDTIRTMEGRVSSDLRLNRFLKDMADIRRIAQIKLNNIHQVKKNSGG